MGRIPAFTLAFWVGAIAVGASTPAAAAVAAAPKAAAASSPAAAVTALADRYVAEFKIRFPIQYAFVGLPGGRNDGIDINAPADLAKWREFEKGLDAELHRIQPDTLAGQPEWVTWHFLNQAFAQDAKTLVCRNELWGVSPFGWQWALSQLAGIQPVNTAEARTQALARWRQFGPWIDQEIANLKEGQRLGFSATDAAVKSTIGQL